MAGGEPAAELSRVPLTLRIWAGRSPRPDGSLNVTGSRPLSQVGRRPDWLSTDHCKGLRAWLFFTFTADQTRSLWRVTLAHLTGKRGRHTLCYCTHRPCPVLSRRTCGPSQHGQAPRDTPLR